MTQSEVVVGSQLFRLGHRIGKGGEGAVFAIGTDSKYAVKLYTTSDIAVKEQKIAAMVRAQLAEHAPLVAFPIAIARSKAGAFVGFVMKMVSDHKPLHDLYSPGSRKHHFPQADYRFLVRTAANLARAVASVHQSKCVIGDINHSGILVSPKATVSLIDADSFQFFEPGKRYLCRVGVPEYTPPELQGRSLADVERTPNHDAFGLAVVVFQLLFMGRHPFVGTVRHGEIPPLHENIQHFRYVYAENRDVGMDQPPGTPAVSDFSPGIASLFDAAFSKEYFSHRPSAEQWIKELDLLEGSLEKCPDNHLHFVPRDASECAWCEMERQLSTLLFLPYFPRAELRTEGFDPGAGGFNLDLIWAKIEAGLRLVPGATNPVLSPNIPQPSQRAQKAISKRSLQKPIGYIALATAVGAFFIQPALWIVWLPLAFWGYGKAKEPPAIDRSPFERAYIEAETSWNKALDDWKRRTGISDLASLQEELRTACDAYRSLSEEERGLRARYQSERREKQLYAYLDRFDIRHYPINGIGPAKQTTLASYGIDTAADVNRAKLLSVPGFGEVNSKGLLIWRATLERGFVYQSHENDTDRQELARICSIIEAKASPLRRKLSVGPHNVEVLVKQIQKAIGVSDPVLNQIHRAREQAKCDLGFLGMSIPTVPTQASQQAQTKSSQYQTKTSTSGYGTYGKSTTTSSSPTCPRCSSRMVRRLAKRGRNAGNYFWGCSRYPGCKGTRS
jgi:DNA-binding helix-hairpin-helix protein with protein kinase domain